MNESEERIKTEAQEAAKELTEAADPAAGNEASSQESDPYVGIQESTEEPFLDPIEDEVKYVYQKGDFWAFLIAALRVFVPILLLFFGGIMLVVWFFSR
jgi:hypothetical protein